MNTLALVAGGVGALGALLIIWACALPLDTFSGNGISGSSSIFNSGSDAGLWFAVEPVGVAVLGLAAAVLYTLSWRIPDLFGRATQIAWLAAGALIGFGCQTLFMFAGYKFGLSGPQHPGSASIAGLLGGLALLGAGVVGVFARMTSTDRPIS